MNRIEMFLREGNEKGASDIHLAPGSPVMFRIDGELVPASDEKIKPFEIEEMIEPLLTEEQKAELQKYILFETRLSRFRELQRKQQSFWYLSQNILKK